MSEIITTISELNAKTTELQSLNQEFIQQREELVEIEAALNGMWEGEAKSAFDQAFHSDITQFSNFSNAISRYIEALTQIAQNYAKTEQVNVEIAKARNYQ